MNKGELIKCIETYNSQKPVDENSKRQIIDYLKNTDMFWGKQNKEGHITASAWIVNERHDKVLLTHHQKLNRWLQLGGHIEKEENIIEAALREAREESGLLRIKLLSKEIFDLDVHPIPERKDEPKHLRYDIRFLFQANEYEPLIISNESKDLKWVELDNINHLTNEESIKRMCRKTKI